MLETSLTGRRAIAHPVALAAVPLAAVERAGFEQAILPRDGASLVLFGAAWRRAGRDATAQLRRVADRRGLLAVFVDVEKSPELARRYRVTAIPSLLLFQGGQEAARRLGELDEDGLEDWLASALA
jgi:thioredoxin 1